MTQSRCKIFILTIVINFLFSQTRELEIWARITSRGGKKQIPIAIAEFLIPVDAPPVVASLARDVRKIIVADLDFSLYFKICEPDSLKHFSSSEKKVDYAGWRTTAADILIAGDLILKKEKINFKIRVYDLNIQKLVATKQYEYRENVRQFAHKISDDLIKLLTGHDGISQTKIVFLYRSGKAKELAMVDYDGFNFKQLTNDGKLKLSPEWVPSGKEIIYSAYDDHSLNIYLFDLALKKNRLIFNRRGMNATPTLSPDGRKIACALSSNGNINLHLLSKDGRAINQITYSSVSISPSFAPSGRQLVFCSDRSGSPQIYTVNIDGTDLTRLTFEGHYNTSPVWSPKGDLIAYVGRIADGSNQIFLTDIEGSFYRQLTFEGNNEDPSFSPDGLHIVFASNRRGNWELYTMNWDGSNQRRITTIGGCFSPSWSPFVK